MHASRPKRRLNASLADVLDDSPVRPWPTHEGADGMAHAASRPSEGSLDGSHGPEDAAQLPLSRVAAQTSGHREADIELGSVTDRLLPLSASRSDASCSSPQLERGMSSTLSRRWTSLRSPASRVPSELLASRNAWSSRTCLMLAGSALALVLLNGAAPASRYKPPSGDPPLLLPPSPPLPPPPPPPTDPNAMRMLVHDLFNLFLLGCLVFMAFYSNVVKRVMRRAEELAFDLKPAQRNEPQEEKSADDEAMRTAMLEFGYSLSDAPRTTAMSGPSTSARLPGSSRKLKHAASPSQLSSRPRASAPASARAPMGARQLARANAPATARMSDPASAAAMDVPSLVARSGNSSTAAVLNDLAQSDVARTSTAAAPAPAPTAASPVATPSSSRSNSRRKRGAAAAPAPAASMSQVPHVQIPQVPPAEPAQAWTSLPPVVWANGLLTSLPADPIAEMLNWLGSLFSATSTTTQSAPYEALVPAAAPAPSQADPTGVSARSVSALTTAQAPAPAPASAEAPATDEAMAPAPAEVAEEGEEDEAVAPPPAEAPAEAPSAPASAPAADEDPSGMPPLRITDVKVPPLIHRAAPKVPPKKAKGMVPFNRPFARTRCDTVEETAPPAPAVPEPPSPVKKDEKKATFIAMPAPPPPPAEKFEPRPGETAAQAMIRRMQERRKKEAEEAALRAAQAASLANSDHLGKFELHSMDLDSKLSASPDVDDDLDIELEDHFRPNIFFQNARYSSFAPSPDNLPKHHQLPGTIYFFIRVSDVAPVSLTKPLPPHVVEIVQQASTIRGQESAGPLARIDYNNGNVLGIAGRLDAIIAGLSQLVIEVPSVEAFPAQDPRIEPSSLTFQPYHQSSLHGEWLPRINVPVRTDKPRAQANEAARSILKPLKLKQLQPILEYEDGPPSPTQVGNPFASSMQRYPSRPILASERRLREAERRAASSRVEKAASPAPAPATCSPAKDAAGSFKAGKGLSSTWSGVLSKVLPDRGVRGSATGSSEPAVTRGDSAPAECTSAASPTKATSPAGRRGALGRGNVSGSFKQAGDKSDSANAPAPAEAPDKSQEKAGKTASPTKSPPSTLKSSYSPPTAINRWQMSRKAPDTTTPRTPGSSRSLRSAGGHPDGVSGGPPDRSLWPKDFAADSAYEADLETLRAAARKEREAQRAKEREAERLRRAARGKYS